MAWNVEFTSEFESWWESLTEYQQNCVRMGVELLASNGPNLGRPHVDTVSGSKHANLKELRTQCRGRPLRTFFAFDPRRSTILLIGGEKTGERGFYDVMIPLADRLYDEYLDELRDEGLI